MAYIIMIFNTILAIVFYKKDKLLINPCTILFGLWFIIILLSKLEFYDLKSTEDKYYLYMLLGFISFSLGTLIIVIFNKNDMINNTHSNDSSCIELRYRLLIALEIACIVYFMKNAIISIGYILQGNGLDEIRRMAQKSDSILNNRSHLENFIRLIIVVPAATAIEVLVAVDLWFGKRNKVFIALGVGLIFLRIISDAGRTPLFNLIIYLLLAFCIYKSNHKTINISKQKKKIIIDVLVLLIIILGVMTLSRSRSAIFRHMSFYFSMSPYMFQTWSKEVANQNLYGYGLGSFTGGAFITLYFIKNLFGITFPSLFQSIFDIALATDSQWVVIAGSKIEANAYVSMFWFFYLDGRVFGIILGMFIYGASLYYLYIKATKTQNLRFITLYLFFVQGLFFSFIRFPFTNIYYSMAFIIILVSFKSKKSDIVENLKVRGSKK